MEAVVVDRAFVRVAGPDAEGYLQGQLSADVTGGRTGLAFLLEPTGKVCALLRWQRTTEDDAFLLDTDTPAGDAVVARLRRFLLRTKATVEPAEVRCTRVFGAVAGASAVAGADADAPGVVAAVWPPSPDAPVDLLDALAPPGTGELDRLGYERRRILAGVPVCGVDIGADTIPAEVGRWAVEAAVSFTKGCYTGQELVARIDSRGGNVPRPLRVLQSADGASLPPAGEVLDADGKVAGLVTSVAADVALAPLARRLEPGAVVRVGGCQAVVLR
jgi:tRNA-modifying protein YgfZ